MRAARARGVRGARPRRRPRRRSAAAGGPAQAARGRRVDRLDAGAAGARAPTGSTPTSPPPPSARCSSTARTRSGQGRRRQDARPGLHACERRTTSPTASSGWAARCGTPGVASTPTGCRRRCAPSRRVDRTQYDAVYWACRLALCGGPDDLPRFDRVFAAWFGDRPRQVARQQRVQVRSCRADRGGGEGGAEQEGGAGADVPAASTLEQLRERDVGPAHPAERAQLRRLLARLRLPGEPRGRRRRRPSGRGDVDPARTLRAVLRAGGEPARLRHRAHRRPPPPRRAARRRQRLHGRLRRRAAALRPRGRRAAARPPRCSPSAPGSPG